MTSVYHQQFSGIGRLLGQNTYNKLKSAHITVIGIGGVGSWCAESLVRSGVGELTLIDLDDICVTNTNRQLHTLSTTVGQIKAKVLSERLKLINTGLKVNVCVDFVTSETISELIPKSGVIIDAIDSLGNKALIANFCREHELSLVTCGGAAGKQDPTQIYSGDLQESTQDNLLKRLKKKLRNDFDFPRVGAMNIVAVYSRERAKYPSPDGELCFKKDLTDKSMAKLDCAEGMGSSSFVTGTFGFVAAYEAIKLL